MATAKTPWTYSGQIGIPGHCMVAQVWDADGNSLACIEPTENSAGATSHAMVMASAPDFYEAAKAMIARHDEHAVACNFSKCGCENCTPFRAAIAKSEGNG